MICSRCGQPAHEYGADGQVYCSSCLFYGMNRQCWKCRMYLPATELQLFQGQFTCPYCIMDLRDAERGTHKIKGEKPPAEAEIEKEKCEKCGRTLSIVFYFNGRVLCENCIEDEKRSWKGAGPEMPPVVMYKIREERAKKTSIISIITAAFGELLAKLRMRKQETPKSESTQKEETQKVKKTEEQPIFRMLPITDSQKKRSEQFADFKVEFESDNTERKKESKKKGKN